MDGLRANDETFRALVQHSHDIITVHDASGRTLYESPSASPVLGYPGGSLVGRVPFDSVHPKDLARARTAFDQLIQGESSRLPIEFRFRHADGHWIHLEALGSNLLQHPGIRGVVLTSRDVTERKQAETRAQYLVQHDGLTGLPNRLLMNDRLQQAIGQARRSGSQVALMFIDLDRFKMVNDTFGHVTGDTLLKQVAARLVGCLRDTDTVARLGGDEFTIMLPDVAGSQMVGEVVQRVLGEFTQPFSDGDHELFVSASIGISLFPRDANAPDELVKHADTAMYSAKDSGRNNYCYFTEDLNVEVREKVMMESGLRRAIERDELRLYYQPKIDLSNGRVMGAESLVRWQHPTLGLIGPGRFMPVAEENGLIVPLDEWVLREACRRPSPGSAGPAGRPRRRQLSPVQFRKRTCLCWSRRICRNRPRSAPARTRTHREHRGRRPRGRRQRPAAIARHGRSRLDRRFRHRLFVAQLREALPGRSPEDRPELRAQSIERSNDAAIVRAIITLGHSLDLEIVAEGVEDDSQLSFLNAYGCNYGQGFLFGRPLDSSTFLQLVTQLGTASN